MGSRNCRKDGLSVRCSPNPPPLPPKTFGGQFKVSLRHFTFYCVRDFQVLYT